MRGGDCSDARIFTPKGVFISRASGGAQNAFSARRGRIDTGRYRRGRTSDGSYRRGGGASVAGSSRGEGASRVSGRVGGVGTTLFIGRTLRPAGVRAFSSTSSEISDERTSASSPPGPPPRAALALDVRACVGGSEAHSARRLSRLGTRVGLDEDPRRAPTVVACGISQEPRRAPTAAARDVERDMSHSAGRRARRVHAFVVDEGSRCPRERARRRQPIRARRRN